MQILYGFSITNTLDFFQMQITNTLQKYLKYFSNTFKYISSTVLLETCNYQ